MPLSNPFSRSFRASPDINAPVATIRRERTTKMVGALGGLALVATGLFVMPFLDFRHGFDVPADATPTYEVDRGYDQQAAPAVDNGPGDAATGAVTSPGDSNGSGNLNGMSDTVTNERTEPSMMAPSDAIVPPPPAPVDMNDQGARGAPDTTDMQSVTPDNRPSGDAGSSYLPPSSDSLNEQ